MKPGSLLLAAILFWVSSPAAEEPRFTPPPGEETPEIEALIERAKEALRAGRSTTDLLVDPDLFPAHEWPRFRRLIRHNAPSSSTTIVTPQEPGDPMVVRGMVRAGDSGPAGGALIYVYQTSAKGWYSDRAAHVSGMEGDTGHARLFGYLRTAADGSYEFRTVRPAGYPGTSLPAHIHVHIETPGASTRVLVSEIQFDDDPRLTPPERERSRREGFLVCGVSRVAGGIQQVRADFTIR
jgi:protocatechuate 3,4-dioxygenase beta subunit